MNEVTATEALIAALPPESQKRVEVIATILRDLLNADEGGEVELAFTLVMAELCQ